jgi:hypothetical protein
VSGAEGRHASEPVEVFVGLLDEGIDVWRPVRAEHLRGSVYKIVDQPYDREIESWQFEPGDEVICETVDSNDGQILAAIALAEG